MSDRDAPRPLVGWTQYLVMTSKQISLQWTARGLFCVGLLLLLISALCIVIGIFDLLAHFDLLAGLAKLLVAGALCGWGVGVIWLTDNVSTEAENIEEVTLLTRNNAKHLPEVKTLLRGSGEPEISPSDELLRGAPETGDISGATPACRPRDPRSYLRKTETPMTIKPTVRLSAGLLSVTAVGAGLLAWPLSVQRRQEHLQDALFHAVRQDNADKVRDLLVEGADPNAVWTADSEPANLIEICRQDFGSGQRGSARQFSALMEASVHSNMAIATLLLDAGADVNARSANGYTPLFYAAYNNRFYSRDFFMIFLVEHGADIDEANPAGRKAWQIVHMDPNSLRYLQQEAARKRRICSEFGVGARTR